MSRAEKKRVCTGVLYIMRGALLRINLLFLLFFVREMDNGSILLEPRELTVPLQISSHTLAMMDKSIKNFKAGNVSALIDLSDFQS